MKTCLLFLALFTLIIGLPRAEAQQVTAALIADQTAVTPGQPLQAGIRLDIEDHWHIYWRNPGDSGLATQIDWDLPEGFTAGPIQWPYPAGYEFSGLMNYGYENELMLLVDITPPAELDAAVPVVLKADVSWLVCKESCIPGDAPVELSLPVASAQAPSKPAHQDLFEKGRAALPAASTGWSSRFEVTPDSVELTFQPPETVPQPLSAGTFYPFSEELIQHAAEQIWLPTDSGYGLVLARSEMLDAPPESIEGVLVYETAGQTKAVTIEAVPAGAQASPTSAQEAARSGLGRILVQMLFAFAGGLILNLMPCVFPVISIKIMGFVSQSEDDPAKVRKHGWLFTAGVLVSFWILAGVLIILRSGGAQIGWGFQLQSPGFIILLVTVFFLFGLNLLGVFEIGTSLTGAGSGLTSRNDAAGTFFSGFLATVIATPCTAPLMGSALFFALTQPALVALLIFSALGFGMATPYLLLSHHTGLLKHIPKPGPWMETMKQIMGFLLIATVLWLASVLGTLTGTTGLVALLFGLLLMAIGAWILGRWGALHRSTKSRWIARILCLLFIAAGAAHAVNYAQLSEGGDANKVESHGGIEWQAFSPERLAELRADGQRVFLDFTADWCLTCKVNEKVAFTPAVAAKFKELDIVPLKADWTRRDAVIAKALEGYGRSGVPLYVLYGSDPAADPIILPSLIKAGTVLDAVSKLD